MHFVPSHHSVQPIEHIGCCKHPPHQVILNYAVLELRIKKNKNNKSFIKYLFIFFFFFAGGKTQWDKDGWTIILLGGDPVIILQPITFMCVRVWISAGHPSIYTDNNYNTHFLIAQNCNGTGPFEK